MKPVVLVGGRIAQRPFNAGGAWVRLNWLLGFERLGYDAYLVDHIESWRCVDRAGVRVAPAESVNAEYFRRVVDDFGLRDRATLLCDEGETVVGLPATDLLDLAAGAELLVNIDGAVRWPALLQGVQRVAYVDQNPGFTQLGVEQGLLSLAGHDVFFTYGANLGTDACPIPTGKIAWQPTRPPVVLESWPVVRTPDPTRFSTVSAWRAGARGAVGDGREGAGTKADELLELLELPRRAPYTFEIALRALGARPYLVAERAGDLDAEGAEIRSLEAHGWRIVDPYDVVPDPHAYREYVQGSGAELSVAKRMYVANSTGWFSDRSACYLASGKPVVVQDTGFGLTIPVGRGLLAFRTLDDAVAAVEEVAGDYEAHCRAAREVAEALFDSDVVVGAFLEQAGAGT